MTYYYLGGGDAVLLPGSWGWRTAAWEVGSGSSHLATRLPDADQPQDQEPVVVRPALTDADLFLEGLARPDRQTLGVVAHGAPLHVPRQPLVHHPGPHRVLWRTEYGRLMRDSFAEARTTYYTHCGNFCKSFDNRFKRQLLTKNNADIQKSWMKWCISFLPRK